MKEKLCATSPKCKDRTVSVTLDIPADLLEQVQEAANLDGTSYQSLMVCYVQQGLQDSKGDVKRMQFSEQAKKILEKHGVHDNAIEEIFANFQY
jgi:hypothetical protein